jgi:predicted nucleic acid-binding protein
MCIVIDTNTVAAVFNPGHEAHQDFKPVLNWVLHGKGKLVYGGAKYKQEVFVRMSRFRRVLVELNKKGKCVVLDHAQVDAVERRVQAAEPSTDLDDAHLIAIFDVSGCQLLCSHDARADRFVKDPLRYDRHRPPRIYRSADHRHLLCEDNIATCCRPSEPLAKPAREAIQQALGPA